MIKCASNSLSWWIYIFFINCLLGFESWFTPPKSSHFSSNTRLCGGPRPSPSLSLSLCSLWSGFGLSDFSRLLYILSSANCASKSNTMCVCVCVCVGGHWIFHFDDVNPSGFGAPNKYIYVLESFIYISNMFRFLFLSVCWESGGGGGYVQLARQAFAIKSECIFALHIDFTILRYILVLIVCHSGMHTHFIARSNRLRSLMRRRICGIWKVCGSIRGVFIFHYLSRYIAWKRYY